MALIFATQPHFALLASFSGELLLGGIGVVLLVLALWRFTRQIPRHLLATAP